MKGGMISKKSNKNKPPSVDSLKTLETLFEYAPDAYFLNDFEGNFVAVNQKTEEISGYKKEEMVGKNFLNFPILAKEDFEKAEQSLMRNMKGEKTGPEEYGVIRKGGSRRIAEITSYPIGVGGKNLVLNIARDITESKALKDELKKYSQDLEKMVKERTAALYESEAKYKHFFNSLPVCVKVLDPIGNLIAINQHGRREHYLDNFVGEKVKNWDWKNSLEKSSLRQVEEKWKSILAGEVVNLEVKHITGSSRSGYCDLTFVPVQDKNGKTIFILGHSLDITEQKKSEERAKELNNLRNKFIQIVSHQLRTPLNSIRWNLENMIAEEFGKLAPEQKNFLRITYDANVEVINRIGDMLTAMDIEEGRVTLKQEEISMESVWASIIGEFKKKCEIKRINLEYQPPKEPIPSVICDPDKIHDILEKLTDNAITYTPADGKIMAFLKKTGGMVRFEITDTGIGIPNTEQPRIFTRFYRATNAHIMKTDASGIGLSIAKYFVEQHGGAMGFQSEEGKGSTFWFEIPISR